MFPVDTHSQHSDSSSIPIIPWSFTKTTICPSFTPALSITQPADTYLRHSLFSSPSPNSFQARSALPPALLNILHSLLTVITVHSLFLNLHSSLQNQDLPPPPSPIWSAVLPVSTDFSLFFLVCTLHLVTACKS